MKVWCASGVNLNGGYTKDGGCIVGASIFYSTNQPANITEITTPTSSTAGGIVGEPTELESLDKQLSLALDNADADQQLSSYVWICTSTHSASTVTVIDAKNPAAVLDSFPVCQKHLLCVCSVIGALEKDYKLLENSEVTRAGETLQKPGKGPDDLGRVEFIKSAGAETAANATEEQTHTVIEDATAATDSSSSAAESPSKKANGSDTDEKTLVSESAEVEETPSLGPPLGNAVVEDIKNAPSSPINLSPTAVNQKLLSLAYPKPINPILGSANPLEEPPMSSIGPTMWLGAQNGMLYVHSSIARWRDCLHSVRLSDAVVSIVHVESRVIAALANGKLAIFRRQTDGQWDVNNYHLVTLGSPKQSVRCLCIVGDKVWAAHRNKIHVVDPITLCVLHTLEAHPRKESQVRQMAATGLGVWVSIRLDSTLRLYHAHTYEHQQDVDIEPYVSKMLGTGKLGFSFVRITALLISCNRLWIGTGNGVVISVPLTDMTAANSKTGLTASKTTFIPHCCMANAQLSFHGHRDAVKFFVSVPMSPPIIENPLHFGKRSDMLVMSGGEGYIDFRLGECFVVYLFIKSKIFIGFFLIYFGVDYVRKV